MINPRFVRTTPSVAVVGAGIAGLSCATELAASGFRVRLFDKSGGVSGRAATRRGGHWQCDHGAQYFTAREPVFRAEVARWQKLGAAALWQPRLARIGIDGLSPLAGGVERFVGVPRMTAPAELLASVLPLKVGAPITAIVRDAACWRLQDSDGAVDGCFDSVVLALPSPQAAPLLDGVAPLLAAQAASVAMQPCWAAILRYPATAASGPDCDAAFVENGPLAWIARDSAKPGRGGELTWLLHASAAWSAAHLEDDPADVGAALVAAFVALGGPPSPLHSVHRWRYARAAARDDDCLWDAGRRIGACGDWLAGGTVEAAWLSGRALAHRITGAY